VTDVEGADTLARTCRAAADDLDDMAAAHQEAGRLVEQRARGHAPKDTGALATSIRADATGSQVAVGSPLIYAGVQEFGWAGHNIRAQPFLAPAMASTDVVVRPYEDAVAKAVAQIRGA
jgi:HK97 gp10 family phage protein